jgi:hypothetical protein
MIMANMLHTTRSKFIGSEAKAYGDSVYYAVPFTVDSELGAGYIARKPEALDNLYKRLVKAYEKYQRAGIKANGCHPPDNLPYYYNIEMANETTGVLKVEIYHSRGD